MADIDRLIGFMAIMQVPFMNDPDALAYIEEVKTVLKQVKVQEPGWISVKDRMPEKTKRYMCLCYDFVTKSYWHELLWYENNHWWTSLATLEHDYTKHVVYWMPLPEPPKEEEHEQ